VESEVWSVKWKFDGYTKVKVSGKGQYAKYVTTWIYKCSKCGYDMRVKEGIQPPSVCPGCGEKRDEA